MGPIWLIELAGRSLYVRWFSVLLILVGAAPFVYVSWRDWKVVDEAGRLIQNGAYSEGRRMGGNDAILQRHYRSKRRQRQRLILNVKRDIQQASVSDTRLHVGVPERGLEQAYGSTAALKWLLFVAGPGTIILIVFEIWHGRRRYRPVH